MTATGHALIGTVIAAKIGNYALAIPIALGSHFLADVHIGTPDTTGGKRAGSDSSWKA
jgi:hypothetical protein